MDVRTVPLGFDAAGLVGLSEKLIRSHHQNNYGGAVKRLNGIRRSLGEKPAADRQGFELNGLKREELVAANSMMLHEVHSRFLTPRWVASLYRPGSGWYARPREASRVKQRGRVRSARPHCTMRDAAHEAANLPRM